MMHPIQGNVTVSENHLPAIVVTARDLSRLDLLTGRITTYRSPVMATLAFELARARVVSSVNVPAETVTMGSTVRYRDGDTGQIFTVTLVYPADEDRSEGKLSVLTGEGCALIGLSEIQTIRYATEDGNTKWLTVLRVLFQPEAQRLALGPRLPEDL
jgi:regulator of nucleoside diphosphate kinase